MISRASVSQSTFRGLRGEIDAMHSPTAVVTVVVLSVVASIFPSSARLRFSLAKYLFMP